jgi:benzoate/toluate 1,2-dioxygenase alpha subunit
MRDRNSPIVREFSDLVEEREDDFRISTTAYWDRKVYEAELSNIFYATWMFLGHESEIPMPGDFKTVQIGERSVFIIRDASNSINAFINACAHRGAALCRTEYGNKRVITCPYHAWSFTPGGKLLGLPDPSRFPASFSKEEHGLTRMAQTVNHHGLLFGTFNTKAPSFEDYLGPAARYFDLWLKRAVDGTFKVGRAHKYAYCGNWKFQSENVIDGYHPQIVHRAAFGTLGKFGGANQRKDFVGTNDTFQGGCTRGLSGGHSTLEARVFFESSLVDAQTSKQYIDNVIAKYGAEVAKEVLSNRHLLLFPNVALMDHLLRVWFPVGVDRTEVFSYPLRNEGISPALDSGRFLDSQLMFSASGFVGPDDLDIFAAAQTGARSVGVGALVLSRGMEKETITSTGERIGEYGDEVPQRSFWRQWQVLMQAGEDKGVCS